jgi:hypothetical protein
VSVFVTDAPAKHASTICSPSKSDSFTWAFTQHNHLCTATNTTECKKMDAHRSSFNVANTSIFYYITLHYIALHCISFPRSRVSQNDCRMWNMSCKYKSICTVQLKFSHTKTQWHMRLFKNTSTYVHQYYELLLFTQPLNGWDIFRHKVFINRVEWVCVEILF